MAKGQSERLFPMIDEILTEAGVDFGDLDAVAVGTGPGNFTGIRIAVSAARGLALSLDIPAVGVTLFEALACGTTGPTLRTIGGPRDQVYFMGPNDTAIALAKIHDLPPQPAGTLVVGHRSDEVAEALGLSSQPAAFAPASAIARVAATRWRKTTTPPAPLYFRAPDAAPSRVVPPEIVP